ncbi:hypothetical protein BJ912DRAFT_995404 [Pholiota molesta]|nr:hypothetical protein BJ912DRAFT_995404 [Pholiota molesta]
MADPSQAQSSASTTSLGLNISEDQLERMLTRLINARFESAPGAQASQPASSATAIATSAAETIPPFVPPPNPVVANSGESLVDRFPSIPRAIIIEIVRHEIHPLNLYKLDIRAQDRISDAKNTVDLEDGRFTIRERTGGVKDYPTMSSLLEPLMLYFHVLGAHAASSGNAHAVLALLESCASYISHLSWLNRTYLWSAVLLYHKHFFLIRQKEMARGIYNGWKHPNPDLVTEYLLGHGRPAQSSKPKPSSNSSAFASKASTSTQTCFPFNRGSCTASPCPSGRIHKCQKCDSTEHGALNCKKGQ